MNLLEPDSPHLKRLILPIEPGVMRGLGEPERGEIASDEQVEAAYRSFDE
ncbi:MAG TPA: hypothetical protein VHR44_13785 [Beijerinckiaceae bacterium]|jgi:hypothetical protein|nr:hypothetical protein [Beijerinckiaceae bacterium]